MARRFLQNPSFDIETGALLSHDGESFEEPVILCDRSVHNTASANSKTATGTGNQFGQEGQQIASSIIPGLEQEATHPTGFDPTTLNNMRVGSAQALGGATSGITGEANLEAARTRNAGGFAAALDEAARQRMRQASSNELGIQTNNANLANEKQMQAQKELAGLYGTDTSNQLKSMGLANEDLNTELGADKTGWVQNVEGGINSLANVASAYRRKP
jgi:hypothetical protein